MDQVDKAQNFDQMRREIILDRRVPRPQAPSTRTHCVDCEERIPDARKAAIPETEHCTFCADQLEQNEARK